jgi:hypothetical protein
MMFFSASAKPPQYRAAEDRQQGKYQFSPIYEGFQASRDEKIKVLSRTCWIFSNEVCYSSSKKFLIEKWELLLQDISEIVSRHFELAWRLDPSAIIYSYQYSSKIESEDFFGGDSRLGKKSRHDFCIMMVGF